MPFRVIPPLLLFGSSFAVARNPPAANRVLPLDGAVTHIEPGRDGVRWFQLVARSGTHGVARFDGTNFTSFGLRSRPWSLLAAADGRVFTSTWA